MIPVISKRRWIAWANKHGLDLESTRFAIETCYYGTGIRSRPGTLTVTDSAVIHYSYRWFHTFWAMFEPSLCVSMPFSGIVEIRKRPISFLLRIAQLSPDALFRISLSNGDQHDLILQRGARDFETALEELGFSVLHDDR